MCPALLLAVLQLTASNMEGRSCPSEVLVCTTSPDRPGPPTRPLIKGPVTSHGFSVKWGTFSASAAAFPFWLILISVVTNQTQAHSIACGSIVHVLHTCEKHPEDWRRPSDFNVWPDFSGLLKWTILRVSHLFHNFLILQFSSLYKCIVDLNLRIHN